MIAGLRKHAAILPSRPAADIASIADLIARFQAHLDAMQDVARKEIAWNVAREEEARLEREIQALLARVKAMLQSSFGPGSTTLRDFGVKPYRRRKPSASTMKLAVEKRRATRTLRRTMGRKQRARAKGGG